MDKSRSSLVIWHCQCCGSGHCCSFNFISDLGTYADCRHGKKKKGVIWGLIPFLMVFLLFLSLSMAILYSWLVYQILTCSMMGFKFTFFTEFIIAGCNQAVCDHNEILGLQCHLYRLCHIESAHDNFIFLESIHYCKRFLK